MMVHLLLFFNKLMTYTPFILILGGDVLSQYELDFDYLNASW